MEQMRERVARVLCVAAGQDPDALSYHDGLPCWTYYINQADAALSPMQPEIDRRVAEEKAKLAKAARLGIIEGLEMAAKVAEDVDLFEGDVLKNSDPRVTIAAARDCCGDRPIGTCRPSAFKSALL